MKTAIADPRRDLPRRRRSGSRTPREPNRRRSGARCRASPCPGRVAGPGRARARPEASSTFFAWTTTPSEAMSGSDGRSIRLYVGYYATQRQGATIHSPLNCLPGAGWIPVELGRKTIDVQAGPDRRTARHRSQSGGD